MIETQDAGLKIGTETTSDIHDINFERCQIKTSSRGLCIQLRDEGNIYNIDYRDITLYVALLLATRGGAAAKPFLSPPSRARPAQGGSLHHVTVQNVTGHAENSVRVRGFRQPGTKPPVCAILHSITCRSRSAHDRSTKAGCLTTARPQIFPAIEPHDTPGFSIESADNVTLRDCSVAWGPNPPEYFSYAVEAKDTTALKIEGLTGGSAHKSLGKAVSIS